MNREKVTTYRFHSKIAVNPPNGPTFYMDVEEARILMRALKDLTDDALSTPFTESKTTTREAKASDQYAL